MTGYQPHVSVLNEWLIRCLSNIAQGIPLQVLVLANSHTTDMRGMTADRVLQDNNNPDGMFMQSLSIHPDIAIVFMGGNNMDTPDVPGGSALVGLSSTLP